MADIKQIIKEHDKMRFILSEIELYITAEKVDLVIPLIKKLGKFWDEHEIMEEKLIKSLARKQKLKVSGKMLLDQHKQIRGHWKLINGSIKSKDKQLLLITLDTDGKMLIQKFRSHFLKEEEFFNKSISNSLAI